MSWLSEAITRQNNDIGETITNTPTRQRMNELRAAYRAGLDQVRGDASLSKLGQQQMIARAWTNTRNELARLAQADFDTQVTRFNTLESQVFGATASTGADAVSFRDATDRAGKLTNQQAATIALGTAELSGDTVLAKAVVLRAWQEGWIDIVEAFAANHPTVTDKLAELGALRKNLESRASGLGGNMGAGLPRPSEIQNFTLAEVDSYATAEPARSLETVMLARIAGNATPQEESAARAAAVAEAQARNNP